MICDYIVMDTETTGLNPKLDKIIEIGAAKVRGGKVVDTFATFVNPGRCLPQRIEDITGITDDDLADAPYIEEVIPDFLNFVGEDVLLGHNLICDYSFIKKACVDRKIKFERQGIDTLKIARRFLTNLESRQLGRLCEHYGIHLDAHRAYNDAYATHELYQKLVAEFYDTEADLFNPKPLMYQVKKDTPATKKQLEYIRGLAFRLNLHMDGDILALRDVKDFPEAIDMNRLTKSEASRLVDRLRVMH